MMTSNNLNVNCNTGSTQNLVVNWHMLEPCQFKCEYCYAQWQQPDKQEVWKVRDLSQKLIAEIARLMNNCSVRLSLAGGEPLLDKHIGEKMAYATQQGLLVSLITNGQLLTQRLNDDDLRRLYMLGVSIDSFDDATLIKIGRATTSGKTANHDEIMAYIDHVRSINPGIKVKINTVVNRHNWNDNLTRHIERIRPDKWKIMRVLPSSAKARKQIISDEQFQTFKQKHEHLDYVQFEDNDDMRDSYLMLDPYGRFFSNSGDEYTYSDPVTEVGILQAMEQAHFDLQKFLDRYNGEVE